MIAVDVCPGSVLQIVFLHERKDLLPARQILHKPIQSLKCAYGDQGIDESPSGIPVLAHEENKIKSGQVRDQKQKLRNRFVRCDAEHRVERGRHISLRVAKEREYPVWEGEDLKQNQCNQ